METESVCMEANFHNIRKECHAHNNILNNLIMIKLLVIIMAQSEIELIKSESWHTVSTKSKSLLKRHYYDKSSDLKRS